MDGSEPTKTNGNLYNGPFSLPIGSFVIKAKGFRDGWQESTTAIAQYKAIKLYCAGNYLSGGVAKACYWINGKKIDLPAAGTQASYASSILVSGGSVYVSGNAANGACYWKNGNRIDLPGNLGFATDIRVSSGSVYVSGGYYTGSKNQGCYWKDGIKTDLVDDGMYSVGQALEVVGNQVYVAGIDNLSNGLVMPSYWSNNNLSNLSFPLVKDQWGDWNNGSVYDICVDSGNVYVAGGYTTPISATGSFRSHPCYWQNGTRVELNGDYDSEITALSVNGTDVYAIGYFASTDLVFRPCYWQNGTRYELYNEADVSLPSAIDVVNGTVYAAGYYTRKVSGTPNYIACYWRDDQRFDLENGAGSYSLGVMVSLFVQDN
jgi:hypothetical protein